MTEQTWDRLFGYRHAFDDPVVIGITAGTAAALAIAPLIIFITTRIRGASPERRRDVWARYLAWFLLVPLMGAPVLLGAGPTIFAVGVLSLLCYREFARATGLFRERVVTAVVTAAIVAIVFAVADHWYDFFVALVPLSAILIASAAILTDRPQGYIQRVALGTFAVLFFGGCYGHLGYIANDAGYRPLILTVLVCVEANDIFAFTTGRLFGRRKLIPKTSPGKTVAGSIGALVLTTALYSFLGRVVFAGTPLSHPIHLVALGLIISVGGQLGDLMLSSIKRDLGIKDFATTIPGHGGLLDRFDSLILVSPAFFHYVGYFTGFGWDQPTRIFSGGP